MRKVDLGGEIGEVRCAIEGVRVMADTVAFGSAPDPETASLMPRRISALLTMSIARLRQVERALNGTGDPAELHARHNRVVGPEGVHLRGWSPDQREKEAQRLLRELAVERGTTKRQRPRR